MLRVRFRLRVRIAGEGEIFRQCAAFLIRRFFLRSHTQRRNRAFFQFRRGYAAYAVVFTRGYVILAYVGNRAATEFLRYVTLPLGRFSASSVRELPTYGAHYTATLRAHLMNEFSTLPPRRRRVLTSSAEYERAIDDPQPTASRRHFSGFVGARLLWVGRPETHQHVRSPSVAQDALTFARRR